MSGQAFRIEEYTAREKVSSKILVLLSVIGKVFPERCNIGPELASAGFIVALCTKSYPFFVVSDTFGEISSDNEVLEYGRLFSGRICTVPNRKQNLSTTFLRDSIFVLNCL